MSNKTEETIYLLSNGSTNSFTNTLTKFTNNLPKEFECSNENRYEIRIESIGFSASFKNIELPPRNLPSLFLSPMGIDHKGTFPFYSKIFFQDKFYTEKDLEEKFASVNELTQYSNLSINNGIFHATVKSPDSGYWLMIHPSFMRSFDIPTKKDLQSKIFTKKYLCGKQHFEKPPKLLVYYDGKRSYFVPFNEYYDLHEIPILYDNEIYYGYYIYSKTLTEPADKFKHLNYVKDKFHTYITCQAYTINHLQYNENIPGIENFKERCIDTTKEHLYDPFTNALPVLNTQTFNVIGLSKVREIKPSLIKVKCDNIDSQIFNNQYSKDLTVFSPVFGNDRFFFKEFSSKEYCTVTNTLLKNLTVSLCDEKDEQLQLLPATATLIKVNIRKKMKSSNESFNIRVTSEKNEIYPTNKNSKFSVVLPSPLQLTRDWKVALTSISFPSKFRGYMDFTKPLLIEWTPSETTEGSSTKHTWFYNTSKDYSQKELVDDLSNFFTTADIGNVQINPFFATLEFIIKSKGTMEISDELLKMFGFSEDIVSSDIIYKKPQKGATVFDLTKHREKNYFYSKTDDNIGRPRIKADYQSGITLTFFDKINLEKFYPNYIMLYADFISSTIVGGEYTKLFKIIPIKSFWDNHATVEFKNKEFHELQNTHLEHLEFELRAHDGSLIELSESENVILNMEFKNN